MRFLKSFGLVLLLGLLHVSPVAAQFPPAPGTGPGLPETIEAIDSARVTTRILYITAHPDDESAAMLTYLARGLHADVALLTLTHGEGGQNALGPEQGSQLGLIRTQELLAATRGYGVKLYFTRARDLGYSKTIEETQKIWGDQVLEDMVRVIRSFRPNIVINGWGGVHTGHGHHQLSGLWTPKAVALAADPKAYAELSNEHLEPWTGGVEPVQILDIDRGSDKPNGYILPLDEVSPLYGKTWREIGLDAFVNHHTQGIAGFLNSPFLRRPIALRREDGQSFDPSSLARPLSALLSPTECKSLQKFCNAIADADAHLKSAHEEVERQHWQEAANHLESASGNIHRLIPPCDLVNFPWPLNQATVWEATEDRSRIKLALRMVYGFGIEATADRSNVAVGDSVQVSVRYRCRSGLKCPLYQSAYEIDHLEFHWFEEPFSKDTTFNMPISSKPPLKNSTVNPIQPFDESAASIFARTNNESVCVEGFREPIVHVEATSTSVVKVPLRIVPAYTLSVEPSQTIEVLSRDHKPFDIFLRVHSYSTKSAKVSVGLDVPDGLKVSAPVEMEFAGVGDQYAKFTVTPPAKLDPGDFTISAYAKRGDETFSASLEPLPSMPSILWSEPAQCMVHAFDINVPPHLRVGYISAEGELIPEALKRLGIEVDMLDATALNFGDLSKYDAIVVGVRAYELRPELVGANKRLLDYVSAGGTLVVQYNRDFVWDKLQPAPYPAKIGSPTPRVTDETADVKYLQPADPLLNSPNKITAADFNNWVQERGLYYWSVFDSRYTPLLAMHDPGESDLNGSLVYTRYGNGTYIYTGLSFFRQLPEGNSGAYRLFVNLISASRTRQASATH